MTEASPAGAGRQLVAGRLTALTAPAYGAFRRLHRSPAQVAAELTGGPVLAMVVDAPLNTRDIGDVRSAAADPVPASCCSRGSQPGRCSVRTWLARTAPPLCWPPHRCPAHRSRSS